MITAKCIRCLGSAIGSTFTEASAKINHAVGLSRGVKCGDNYNKVREIKDTTTTPTPKHKTIPTPVSTPTPKVTKPEVSSSKPETIPTPKPEVSKPKETKHETQKPKEPKFKFK